MLEDEGAASSIRLFLCVLEGGFNNLIKNWDGAGFRCKLFYNRGYFFFKFLMTWEKSRIYIKNSN